MPLMTLKSKLAWYKNPGWTPNPNVQTSDFQYNDDLTVTAIPRGFDQKGYRISLIPRTSQDAYPIDTALGSNGSAKRKAQRGNGSVFPIGPTGEVHMFDTKRTGWYNDSKYGDTFSNKTSMGLAATYTANSPIDDMYNRFNVRDEVYDPYGYAKPPFILRGIQREGSSDPQRWGFGGTTAGVISGLLDIPRGGPLTAGERAAVDVARIGKFLIRPNGLAFIAKQQLLHLMTPNTENVFGTISRFDAKKLYNPANTLLTIAGTGIGGRFRRYGLLPIDINPLTPTKYEDIHKLRNNVLNPIADPTNDNRLVKLNTERKSILLSILPSWSTISAPMGPDSVGGLGGTTFTKYAAYNTNITFPGTQYDWSNPYLTSRDNSSGTAGPIDTREGLLGFSSAYSQTAFFEFGQSGRSKVSLRKRVETDRSFTGIPHEEVEQAASNETRPDVDLVRYKTLSYSQLPSRQPNTSQLFDFEDGDVWDEDSIPTLRSKYGYKNYDQASKRGGNLNGPIQDQPDPINSIPIDSNYGDIKDLIKFRFAPIKATTLENTNNDIIFRAYLTDLSDNFAPSWDAVQDQGRADAKVRYASFERTVDLGFKVVVHSAAERGIVWKKLSELAKITYPVYGGGGFYGVYLKVTIGDIYVNQPMFITSLSYMWDTETPWEINEGEQVPMYTDVNMSLTWIGTTRPNYETSQVFSYT